MMTPTVSSGSDLLAGMQGSTLPAGAPELGASVMKGTSSRTQPAAKRARAHMTPLGTWSLAGCASAGTSGSRVVVLTRRHVRATVPPSANPAVVR